MFCLFFKFNIFPTSAKTLCLFAQFLSRTFRSISAIKNYISGVRLMHILHNKPCPSFSDIDLRLALRGLARFVARVPRQALPITPELLCRIYDNLDLNSTCDVVMWALCTLAFFTLARKSNLVASSRNRDKSKILTRGDVCFRSFGMLVQFRWTKTIQFNERILTFPVVYIRGFKLCPVAAFKRMLRYVHARDSDPAFCWSPKNPVTYSQFQEFIKKHIALLGINPQLFSSHSFRRGGATWAFRSGIKPEHIQMQGDWQSDAYLKYVNLDLADRVLIAEKVARPLQII